MDLHQFKNDNAGFASGPVEALQDMLSLDIAEDL